MDKVLTGIGVDNYINNKLKIDPSTGVIDPAVSGVDHIVTIKITDPAFSGISIDSSTLQFDQFEYYPDYETIKSWGSSIKLKIITPETELIKDEYNYNIINCTPIQGICNVAVDDGTDYIEGQYIYGHTSAYFDGIAPSYIVLIICATDESMNTMFFCPLLYNDNIGREICPLTSGKIPEQYLPTVWVENILKNKSCLTDASIGKANGIVPLNNSGHIDSSWLPEGSVISKLIIGTLGAEIYETGHDVTDLPYRLGQRIYNCTLSVDKISDIQLYDRININNGFIIVTNTDSQYNRAGIFIKGSVISHAFIRENNPNWRFEIIPHLNAESYMDNIGIIKHTWQLTSNPAVDVSGYSGTLTVKKPPLNNINAGDIINFVYENRIYATVLCTTSINIAKSQFISFGGFIKLDVIFNDVKTAVFSGNYSPSNTIFDISFFIGLDSQDANKANGPLILDSSCNIPENLLPAIASGNSSGDVRTIYMAINSTSIKEFTVDNDTVYDYTAPFNYYNITSIDEAPLVILAEDTDQTGELYLWTLDDKLYKNWTNKADFELLGGLINCIISETGCLIYQYMGDCYFPVAINAQLTKDEIADLIKTKNTYMSWNDYINKYSSFLDDLIGKPLTEIGGGILYKYIEANIPESKFIINTELGSPWITFERLDWWYGETHPGLLMTAYLEYDGSQFSMYNDCHPHQIHLTWDSSTDKADVKQLY